MECAVWQSLQTGSGLSVLVTDAEWMLCTNCSSMPWWQAPHVAGTFLGLTDDSGSEAGSSRCAVWQLVQVAVTVNPLFRSPLPWMLSLYLGIIWCSVPV